MARAVDVAYVLRRHFDSDPGVTKIHKLLYYCQAWHLVWAGQALFHEPIEAWEMGPVVAELWRVERYGPQVTDFEALDPAELRTVEYVAARYGHLWANQLVGQTHRETPWQDARETGQNAMLSNDSLRNFFSADPAADQAWYWDDDWRAGESEAADDIREGRTAFASSGAELVDQLRSLRGDI